MQDIFKIKSNNSLKNSNNLQHCRTNQVTFGSSSLRSLGPLIWNGLPNEMKSAENLKSFKTMMKNGMAKTVNVVRVNIWLEISFILFSYIAKRT